ncbi:UNVERIFIED_CONTAM: hypothetical protein Slati_4255700 [Sesamum latifolium]|uniref:Uncharacterized protein n=1 Tax=Sesamum latifolium TaxID=2727402 RepID=A0AAW2TDP4_9LAMI
MSGRGATPHCGHIMKPCRRARKHVGRAVRDHCETLAHQMGPDLRCGPTRARHIERPRRRRGPTDAPSECWDMRRALRAHAERRNAEAGRRCPLPSRDASASSEIVAETHSGRLASRGRPLRDAKACGPRASDEHGHFG